jgi:hypothetical protein
VGFFQNSCGLTLSRSRKAGYGKNLKGKTTQKYLLSQKQVNSPKTFFTILGVNFGQQQSCSRN